MHPTDHRRRRTRALKDHPAVGCIAFAALVVEAWAFWWFVVA